MPPKQRPKKSLKASAKASAKNTTRVTTVVSVAPLALAPRANVAAPRRRTVKPRSGSVAAGQSPLIYQQPPVYLPQTLIHTTDAHQLRNSALLEDIKREVAMLKAPAKEPITPPPVLGLNPLFNAAVTPPSDLPTRVPRRETMYVPQGGPLIEPEQAAAAAVERGAPTAAPRRLARPRNDEPNTVVNPETGAMIRIGSTTYKKLVRKGAIRP